MHLIHCSSIFCHVQVTVSSSSSGHPSSNLTNGNWREYWESSGEQHSHWICIYIKPGICASEVGILVDSGDDSYCPKVISVRADSTYEGLRARTHSRRDYAAEVRRGGTFFLKALDGNSDSHIRVVEIGILDSGGINCKVHGVLVRGSVARFVDNRIVHATLQSLQPMPSNEQAAKTALEFMAVLQSHPLFASAAPLKPSVYESVHPYSDKDNAHKLPTPVKIAGADRYEIRFDSQCHIESDVDTLSFTVKGEPLRNGIFHGNNSKDVWGPLIIPAEEFEFKFVCENASGHWGYKFNVIPIKDSDFSSFGESLQDSLAVTICQLCIDGRGVFIPPFTLTADGAIAESNLLPILQGSLLRCMHYEHIRNAVERAFALSFFADSSRSDHSSSVVSETPAGQSRCGILFSRIQSFSMYNIFAGSKNTISLLQTVIKRFLDIKDHIFVSQDTQLALATASTSISADKPPDVKLGKDIGDVAVSHKPTIASRTPAEKSRVQRGPHWRWFNQDSCAGGIVTLVLEQWAHVKWDNGTSNWYLLGDQPDVVECSSKDTKIPPKLRLTPVEWIEVLLNEIFLRRFDNDFPYVSNVETIDGERVFGWLDCMLQPLDALNLSHSTLKKLTRARLLVHACFSRGLLTAISCTPGSSAVIRMLSEIAEAVSSEQFCSFLTKKIEDVASRSLIEPILSKVWASSFDALVCKDGANASALCRLFGVFLQSNVIPRRVHYGELCDEIDDLNARHGSCLFCNLPWMYHNVHECKVGFNKGSSGEWLRVSPVYPCISASACFLDKIVTSPNCSSKNNLVTEDLSEYCILNDADASVAPNLPRDSIPWIRLVLKSSTLPTSFSIVVDSSEMEFVPKTFAVHITKAGDPLFTAPEFLIDFPILLPLNEPFSEGSMRIIDLSYITSSFTRGCTVELQFFKTHSESSASSSSVSVKIYGIILSETGDILVRAASLALASSSSPFPMPAPTSSSSMSSDSSETRIQQVQIGLKWLQILNEPSDALANIDKKRSPSSDNINRAGRMMSGSDSGNDPDSRFCGRSFEDGSVCAFNSSQCPDCMSGPILILNPSNGSSSSFFAAKMLSPALETAVMNLFLLETGNAPSKCRSLLHVPRELECTPLLCDLFFSHLLSPQYAPAFGAALAAAARSSPSLELHPAIGQTVNDIIVCYSQQSSYADSIESSSPTGLMAAFVKAVDDVTYTFASEQLDASGSNKSGLDIDVIIHCVQEAVASVFGLFKQVSTIAAGTTSTSEEGRADDQHGDTEPVFSEDLYRALQDLDFPRPTCHLALKNAEGNIERACEWIFSNIDNMSELVRADEISKSSKRQPASSCTPLPSSSLPSALSLSSAVTAASTACASRLLARFSAELMVFARDIHWGSSICDKFFTILGQGISSDSAQSVFIAGLRLGDKAANSENTADGAGVIYRMVPSLIPSFMEATRQIKSHPIYGSFKNDSLALSTSKTSLPKPKPKPTRPSDLERSMVAMGFAAGKVQLAMKRNPGLIDVADQRHLNGLMEAIFSLDDGDVELRAIEEEQMAAAIRSTSAAASDAQSAADAAALISLAPASDPIMMKFFGLSAALRYSLSSQGVWDKAGRCDIGMVRAVVASLASLSMPSSVAFPASLEAEQRDEEHVVQSLRLLLDYRQLITSTCKSIIPGIQSKTFESEHPYAHNMNIEFSVSFPGARSIDIVFDPKCRTETSCDYLRFWQGSQQVGNDKYHGGSSGWPSLKLQGDSFRVTFLSDGSQNDWGYKFTATATCPPVTHWSDFQKTSALLLPLLDASVAHLFTRGTMFYIPSPIFSLLDGPHALLISSCEASSVKVADVKPSTDPLEQAMAELCGSVSASGSDDDEAGEHESAGDGVGRTFVFGSGSNSGSDRDQSPEPRQKVGTATESAAADSSSKCSDAMDSGNSESSSIFEQVVKVCHFCVSLFQFLFIASSP